MFMQSPVVCLRAANLVTYLRSASEIAFHEGRDVVTQPQEETRNPTAILGGCAIDHL
jgi:hypothetical protein